MSEIENEVVEPEVNEVAEVAPPAEPDWSPDWKYKVLDQEYEIDEYLRPAITKDKYGEVVDLMTKAKGFDHYKSKTERINSELARVKAQEEEFNRQNQTLGYMGNLLKEKDYATLFRELKIDDEAVTGYALSRLKYQQLPDEERREYDRNLQNSQRLRELEMENQRYQQTLGEQTTQQRAFELNSYLSGPMKEVTEAFDSQAGKPGSFAEAVARQGQLAYYTQRKDLSVQEAVDEVLRLHGRPQSPSQVSANNTANNVSPSAKPYIPNLRSGNQSVVSTTIRNIDDIKNLIKQRENNGN